MLVRSSFIVVGWRWLALCMLIMSPEMKCIDIAKSLTQLLDNFKDASSLPRDVHFGLNLAYKLLSGSSSLAKPSGDRDRNKSYWKTLEYLKVLKSGSHNRNVSVYDEIILESISENSEVWQRSIKQRHLDLEKSKDTFEEFEWIVDKGHPTALDSDKCMAQLGSTKSCVISSKCMSMMISQKPAYGYHKTHQTRVLWQLCNQAISPNIRINFSSQPGTGRSILYGRDSFKYVHSLDVSQELMLLFILMLLLKRCSNYLPINRSIDAIIAEKCSDIYKEHSILLESGVPHDYRDLFLEQSLFCGIAGCSEFLATSALKPIPSWQSKNGCFSANPGSEENSYPDCTNHINSLGLALYANIILQFNDLLFLI